MKKTTTIVTEKSNGNVNLDPQMVGILQSLLAERQTVEDKIIYFLRQCASSKGIRLEDYDLRTDLMAFVPKAPQPKPIVVA